MKHRHLDDQKVENLIANLLRAGVVAAAFVVISGAVLYLGSHPRAHEDYRTFRSEPEELRTVQGIVACAFTGNARTSSRSRHCPCGCSSSRSRGPLYLCVAGSRHWSSGCDWRGGGGSRHPRGD